MRKTMVGWGRLLADPAEILTKEEAQLVSLLHLHDFMVEQNKLLTDMCIRLTRLELFIRAICPNYEALTQNMIQRAMAGQEQQKAEAPASPE